MDETSLEEEWDKVKCKANEVLVHIEVEGANVADARVHLVGDAGSCKRSKEGKVKEVGEVEGGHCLGDQTF